MPAGFSGSPRTVLGSPGRGRSLPGEGQDGGGVPAGLWGATRVLGLGARGPACLQGAALVPPAAPAPWGTGTGTAGRKPEPLTSPLTGTRGLAPCGPRLWWGGQATASFGSLASGAVLVLTGARVRNTRQCEDPMRFRNSRTFV